MTEQSSAAQPPLNEELKEKTVVEVLEEAVKEFEKSPKDPRNQRSLKELNELKQLIIKAKEVEAISNTLEDAKRTGNTDQQMLILGNAFKKDHDIEKVDIEEEMKYIAKKRSRLSYRRREAVKTYYAFFVLGPQLLAKQKEIDALAAQTSTTESSTDVQESAISSSAKVTTSTIQAVKTTEISSNTNSSES